MKMKMKTAIIMIVAGALSLAGGINLALMAIEGPSILWASAGGCIVTGMICLVSGFGEFAYNYKW